MDTQHIASPEAGKDYPSNWNDFLDCFRPVRERLKGLVEVDETYLAITDRQESISPRKRKNNTDKALVAIGGNLGLDAVILVFGRGGNLHSTDSRDVVAEFHHVRSGAHDFVVQAQ